MGEYDKDVHVTLSVIHSDLNHVKESLVELKEEMKELIASFKKDYVTQQEFAPVRLIVYGLVGTVLVGVLGALITLVIKK